jgi:hypothetical protein
MVLAKPHGIPVVILDSLGRGEERGSFLMDHVPRVPVRTDNRRWSRRDVLRGLNVLVDECLKRALWKLQQKLAADRDDLDVAWWAPHAPEPVTFIQWLQEQLASGARCLDRSELRILHPDPPLGTEERATLEQLATLAGFHGRLEPMTPRLLAARGA